MKLRLTTLTIAVSAMLVAAGCATPSLHPKIDVPPRFAQAPSPEEAPEAAWWDGYKDPVLAALIRKAAYENRDVKIAAERVRAARAGEKISRSWLFPQIGASAGGFDLKNGYDSQRQQVFPELKSGSASVDVSWEVDISGRLRAGAAASKAETLATEDAARGVRLLVLTDVATNYFTLVGALRQLDTMRAISAAQDETLRLVKARERAGLATAFDVERAQTDASRAHAAIPPLETIAATSRHRIAVLIGDQAFNASSIVAYSGDTVVPATRAGQPAELLQRRPDVLAAQAQLEAANARRQQAAAEWFPRLFLGAAFGRESVSVNGASLGAARYTNAAALLAMPIFNAGRTQAINDMAESAQKEAAIRYEAAMVSALEDVENALVTLGSERAARAIDAHLGRMPPSRRSAMRARSTSADRSTCCRCSTRNARSSPHASAPTTATPSCFSTASSSTRRSGGGWQVFETDPKSQDMRRPPMIKPLTAACIALPLAAMLGACTSKPPAEPLRAVRTAPNPLRATPPRGTATWAPCAHATRSTRPSAWAARSCKRSVEVGQPVRAGDVIAVLDDTDYRLAEEAARQQLAAATAQAAQAESDRKRLRGAQARRFGQRLRRGARRQQRAHDEGQRRGARRRSSTSRATASHTPCCARRKAASSRR